MVRYVVVSNAVVIMCVFFVIVRGERYETPS